MSKKRKPISTQELREFYRLFLIEAGLPEDTRPSVARRAVRKKVKKTKKHTRELAVKRRRQTFKHKKAKLAAQRQAAKRRRAARKAAKLKAAKVKRLKAQKRRAALKGWETRRRKAKERKRQEKIATGVKAPRTWVEKLVKYLSDARLRDSDRVIPARNADGSVDAELYVPVTNATAYDSLLLIEENMPLLPDSVWVAVQVYFNAKVKIDTPIGMGIDKRTGRPQPVSKKIIEQGGGSISTRYFRSDQQGYAFLKAREAAFYIIEDIQESDKVGAVTGVAVRLHWNKGRKPS